MSTEHHDSNPNVTKDSVDDSSSSSGGGTDTNYLDMSDDAFLDSELSQEHSDIVPVPDDEDVSDSETSETESEEEPDTTDTQNTDNEEELPAEPNSDETESDTPGETEEENTDSETSEIDYKAAYEQLTAPFKANGRDMQVDSVADAIQLMQMGANYNKKMAALKPHLKMVRTLEKHGVLDEDKLSFLIDLDKKNPEAIKKLIKDSDIDVMDLGNDEVNYQPSSYTVNDSEYDLQSAIDEIKESPKANQTLDLVGKQWDEKSRDIIVENPQLLLAINDHVHSGIYDQIQEVIEKERMLGRLSGVSDIEAYRQIGDRLYEQGKFGQPDPKNQEPDTKTPPTTKTPKAKSDPKLKQRKKAAATTKSSSTASKKPSDFNPLALSDDEFEKQFSAKFL